VERIVGTSRICYVWEKYTFKLPRINISRFWIIFDMLTWDSTHKRKSLINELQKWFDDMVDNINVNIIENKLWKKYPEIVMQTKIGVFWIINIQETGIIISEELNVKLWSLLIKHANNHNNIIAEWHTFYEGWNFAFDCKWNLKLVDAWGKSMPHILEQESANFLKALIDIQDI